MPDFSCGINDIGTATDCSDKGGLLLVYAALDSDIDWATMATAPYYTSATNTVIDWAMNAGKYWAKFTFNRKTGRLDALYTNDNGYYEVQLLNLLFRGKSASRSISLGQLVGCCGIVLQVFDNNDMGRVIGKEFVSGEWVNPLSRGKVSRHLDTTGTYGNADDRNRDELDFEAINSHPLPYSTVTIIEMDALLETASPTMFGEAGVGFGEAGVAFATA